MSNPADNPAAATATAPDRLSARVRAGSHEAHQDAERAPFIQDLLAGRLPRSDYARLARQHHAIYAALESAVATVTDEAVRPFLAPELTRLPALEEDLVFLAGPNWAEELPVLASTAAYADHLRSLGTTWAGGLLAHHYVRYLGDLSGGQLIGRVLGRIYGFEGDEGTQFYRFPQIDGVKAFKTRYRELLDGLDWDEEEQQRFIEEVNLAYGYNGDVFYDLAPLPVLASRPNPDEPKA